MTTREYFKQVYGLQEEESIIYKRVATHWKWPLGPSSYVSTCVPHSCPACVTYHLNSPVAPNVKGSKLFGFSTLKQVEDYVGTLLGGPILACRCMAPEPAPIQVLPVRYLGQLHEIERYWQGNPSDFYPLLATGSVVVDWVWPVKKLEHKELEMLYRMEREDEYARLKQDKK